MCVCVCVFFHLIYLHSVFSVPISAVACSVDTVVVADCCCVCCCFEMGGNELTVDVTPEVACCDSVSSLFNKGCLSSF